MSARAARPLPGVAFQTQPPPVPDVLPRMDVAAFVGFAGAGPLDLPVPIEDAAAYQDLFGDDPPLGWDRARNALVSANLGPAVRSFFRNGGLRAHVVRVAGETAVANHFPVPALLRRTAAGLRPAFLAARAEGSWSDDLDVAAVISIEPQIALGASVEGDGVTTPVAVMAVSVLSPLTISPGDLLRLRWSDGSVVLGPVARIDGQQAILDAASAVWLLGAPASGQGPWAAAVFPRHDGNAQALPPLAGEPVFSTDGTATLTFASLGGLIEGQLVRLLRGGDEVWVQVTSIDDVTLAGSPPALGAAVNGRWGRPSAGAPGLPSGQLACDRVRVELWVRAGGAHPRRVGDMGLAPGHPRYIGALPTDSRLFAPDEDFLDDGESALLGRVRAIAGDGIELRTYHADLWSEVATPRFALGADDGHADVYLPLGMPLVPDVYGTAESLPGDAATRDGLGTFGAGPFIDPALAGESPQSLLGQADFIRWQSPSPRRLRGLHALLEVDEVTLVAAPDAGQRSWTTEQVVEPTPLATPVLSAKADAQGNWHLSWNIVDPAASSVLESSADPSFAAPTVVSLAAPASYDVPPSPPGTQWFRVRAYVPAAPQPADAAVVLPDEAAGSFWSDPVQLVTPPPAFVGCGPGTLSAPALSLASPPDVAGSFRLEWSAVPGALRYVVEESTALDFLGAATVYAGSGLDVTIYGRAAGRYNYRVHAEGLAATVTAPLLFTDPGGDGAVFDVTDVATAQHLVLADYVGAYGDETVFDGSVFTARFVAGSARTTVGQGYRYRLIRDDGWPGAPSFRAFSPGVVGGPSNGVSVTVTAAARRVLNAAGSAADRQNLLAVQTALVTLAAARGDLLAVLSLPANDRADDAIQHATRLRASVADSSAWSYACLYHPWLLVGDAAGSVTRVPPDGAACGVMAARAVNRGAWIAPANEPFADALGLTPAIPRDRRQSLYEAQVNLVRQAAQGFITLSADTLADDPELTPVNVRRLLALVRRIALREGPGLVFEPNGDLLRRTVERQFEGLLGLLYRGGAFAGATPDSAFQVAVDTATSDADLGRFVVQLKIAPSLPLTFITVRLVQSGGLTQVTESA